MSTFEDIILPSASRNANGNEEFGGQDVDEMAVTLDVTVVAGTTPTLDVVIEGKDPASGQWFLIKAFSQKTAVARETIFVGHGADTTFPCKQMRARWTIGGTAGPAFTFSIGATGQAR